MLFNGLLAAGLLARCTAAEPVGEEAPVRLPVPSEWLGTERTEAFGVYAGSHKLGWIWKRARREQRGAGSVYVIRKETYFRAKAAGRTSVESTTDLRRFGSAPPYPFLGSTLTQKTGAYLREVTIERGASGYTATITEAKRTRTRELGDWDYTLADETTLEVWCGRPRARGDRLTVRGYDVSALESDRLGYEVAATNAQRVAGSGLAAYECALSSRSQGRMGRAWFDERGRLLRMQVAGMIELRRQPLSLAVKLGEPVDLYTVNQIPVDRALGEPWAIRELTVELQGPGAGTLADGPNQAVVARQGDDVVRVRIERTATRPWPAAEPEIRAALAEDAEHPIRHPDVVALLEKAIGDAATPSEKTARLVPFVHDYIRPGRPDRALSVLDIIRTRTGDCSEHSALFTTLARAAGIPARKAAGLMYFGDAAQRFGQHAWTEVALDGQWVPVDPAQGRAHISATHIRLHWEGQDLGDRLMLTAGFRMKILSVQR
ncbi:MAG: transglutaminase domain-containing protein [Kiritimatiellae bacterium]|nr:transglutaminase domain-containing protein [Kiritimatiellia bacterium]